MNPYSLDMQLQIVCYKKMCNLSDCSALVVVEMRLFERLEIVPLKPFLGDRMQCIKVNYNGIKPENTVEDGTNLQAKLQRTYVTGFSLSLLNWN